MKKNTCVKHFLKLTKILVIKQQKKNVPKKNLSITDAYRSPNFMI